MITLVERLEAWLYGKPGCENFHEDLREAIQLLKQRDDLLSRLQPIHDENVAIRKERDEALAKAEAEAYCQVAHEQQVKDRYVLGVGYLLFGEHSVTVIDSSATRQLIKRPKGIEMNPLWDTTIPKYRLVMERVRPTKAKKEGV